jgi:hypothetical protein
MPVHCVAWPTVAYRGIDRLPYLPTAEEQEQLQSLGRYDLNRLWDSYWAASSEGRLNVEARLASQLKQQFESEGINFEIVYSEILRIPNFDGCPHKSLWSENLTSVLSHRQAVHERLVCRPENIEFLGFDISHPVPTFHSAILQPGLDSRHPSLPQRLNTHGLLDTIEEALDLAAEANSLDYGMLPFCVLGIWSQAT